VVTVVSEIMPNDPASIKYTSRWAVGCISLLIIVINQVELIPYTNKGADHLYNPFDSKFPWSISIVGQTFFLILL